MTQRPAYVSLVRNRVDRGCSRSRTSSPASTSCETGVPEHLRQATRPARPPRRLRARGDGAGRRPARRGGLSGRAGRAPRRADEVRHQLHPAGAAPQPGRCCATQGVLFPSPWKQAGAGGQGRHRARRRAPDRWPRGPGVAGRSTPGPARRCSRWSSSARVARPRSRQIVEAFAPDRRSRSWSRSATWPAPSPRCGRRRCRTAAPGRGRTTWAGCAAEDRSVARTGRAFWTRQDAPGDHRDLAAGGRPRARHRAHRAPARARRTSLLWERFAALVPVTRRAVDLDVRANPSLGLASLLVLRAAQRAARRRGRTADHAAAVRADRQAAAGQARPGRAARRAAARATTPTGSPRAVSVTSSGCRALASARRRRPRRAALRAGSRCRSRRGDARASGSRRRALARRSPTRSRLLARRSEPPTTERAGSRVTRSQRRRRRPRDPVEGCHPCADSARPKDLTDVQEEILKTDPPVRRREDHPGGQRARAQGRVPHRDRRGPQGARGLRSDDPRGVRRAGGVAADLRAAPSRRSRAAG